jgi:coatomer subunit beta
MGDRPCTILIQDDSELVNQADLKKQLEFGGDDEKISALKKIILMTINGEKMPGILMTVIRFVMTNKNHTLKKLTLLFWEVIEKTGPDGKLLSEMILVW